MIWHRQVAVNAGAMGRCRAVSWVCNWIAKNPSIQLVLKATKDVGAFSSWERKLTSPLNLKYSRWQKSFRNPTEPVSSRVMIYSAYNCPVCCFSLWGSNGFLPRFLQILQCLIKRTFHFYGVRIQKESLNHSRGTKIILFLGSGALSKQK